MPIALKQLPSPIEGEGTVSSGEGISLEPACTGEDTGKEKPRGSGEVLNTGC
jgi:hypothetical protein